MRSNGQLTRELEGFDPRTTEFVHDSFTPLAVRTGHGYVALHAGVADETISFLFVDVESTRGTERLIGAFRCAGVAVSSGERL